MRLIEPDFVYAAGNFFINFRRSFRSPWNTQSLFGNYKKIV